MATAPRIYYPDGSGTTTSLTMTTNLTGLVLTGEVDSNIIDIQVNINGSGWVSDPSLVSLSLPSFTVPNLSSYPDGLELEQGQNTILIRAIDISGSYSSASTVVVTVTPGLEAQSGYAPPTGIRLQRNATSVTVSWSNFVSSSQTIPLVLVGYNVYASTGPGGTDSGYLRLNESMIPVDSPTESTVVEYPFPDGEISLDLQNPPSGDEVLNLLLIKSEFQPTTAATGTFDSSVQTQTLAINIFDMMLTRDFRVNINVSELQTDQSFTFIHNRSEGIEGGILNSEIFGTVDDEDPVYYVVTSVFFDKDTGQMIESRYSQEIAGSPLPLDNTTRGIRIREQSTIAVDYINQIQSVQPKLSLIPASTVREVHIEPFANEIEKAYFLMDFVHRAKSFEALIQIDGPGRTGTSVSVASSGYKQALRAALSLSSDAAVQALIDGAFDSLAANYGESRDGRRPAVVNQTFYTTTAPTTADLVVSQNAIVSSSSNSLAPRFRANGAAVLAVNNSSAYYNRNTKRYEVRVQMVADVAGTIGNVAAGDLDTVVSGASGFSTINTVASDFGRDNESNLSLAEKAMRALFSLDSGTPGGYKKTAIGTPGLFEVRIVEAGDDDMMRDYDDVRGKHIGGKVDIYVKGTIERTITESFAFQFEVANNIRFDVIDATNLIFRARDSRLTVSNPINEMLNNPSQDLGLRNQSASPTESYDLTGVVIVDYRTIQLNNAIPQPDTLLDDFIEGDYRFRSNNKFIASVQPIRRVTSVTGEISGVLDSVDGYDLYKTEDPLLNGESTIASDYVSINQVDGIPAGESILVNDEIHVLIGQFEELLDSVGINTFSIAVYSEDRLTEYAGPSDASPDYLIIEGSQTSPVRIVRTESSNIPNGSTVSVDYEKDENFSMVYVVNDVLQQLQTKLNTQRHTAADVIAKQALENPLSIEATIQLEANADEATTDSNIRTAYTVLTDSQGIGGDINQSHITAIMDGQDGVDYVVQPLTKMTLKDGALRIRDKVLSDYEFLSSLSTGTYAVYILTQSLPFDTIDSGGTSTIHFGVFKDDLQMEKASSLTDVGLGLNRSWIIGKDGAIIDGYSDDTTLASFGTAEAIEEERVRLTANKIVVSLDYSTAPPDDPSNHSFSASYIVFGDTSIQDVSVSQIEYLTPGDLTITYREAQ